MGYKISKGADLEKDEAEGQKWGEGMSEAEQSAYAAEPPKGGSENIKITKAMKVFIDGLIEGKSQFLAYKAAYPNAKGADRTIRQNAHRLTKHPGVAHHLKERQEETAEILANDANAARLHVIRGLITHSTTGKQEGTRLKALELIGKAVGLFTPQAQVEAATISVADLRSQLSSHLKTLERVKPAKQTIDVYTQGADDAYVLAPGDDV